MAAVKISVIIPAYNAERTLPACIRSLQALERSDVEILFVDDGSTDRTGELIRASGFRVLSGAHQGPSAARNQGLRAAAGELLAFTDSDCVVPPSWLDTLEDALQDTGATAVGSGQRSPADDSPIGREFQRVLDALGFAGDYVHTIREPRPVRHNPSCNVLYRKQPVLQIGGFREGFYPGEDVDLDRRLERQGHRFAFVPGADVAHYRPASVRGCLRMMYRYGLAQAGLLRLHGPFRLLQVIPFLLLLLVPPALLLLFAYPLPSLLALLLLGALLYAALSRKGRRPLRADLLFGSVAAWHLGFYRGLLRRPP